MSEWKFYIILYAFYDFWSQVITSSCTIIKVTNYVCNFSISDSIYCKGGFTCASCIFRWIFVTGRIFLDSSGPILITKSLNLLAIIFSSSMFFSITVESVANLALFPFIYYHFYYVPCFFHIALSIIHRTLQNKVISTRLNFNLEIRVQYFSNHYKTWSTYVVWYYT